jgi:hypothetical protein
MVEQLRARLDSLRQSDALANVTASVADGEVRRPLLHTLC